MAKATVALNTPNTTQYFYPADGNWTVAAVKIKASTAMTAGAAIGIEISSNTTTGYHVLMGTENAAGADFVGILKEAVASTDTDYASTNKYKLCRIPLSPRAEAFFKVGAGTFTAVDVGKTVEFHSDSLSLAVDTAGKGARITAYISSTKGKCIFSLPATETA